MAALSSSTLLFDSQRDGRWQIYKKNLLTGADTRLTHSAADDFWPKLNPARTRILFYRAPAGAHDSNYGLVELWAMHPDGTGQTRLLRSGANGNEHGWSQHGHVEWHPGGTLLIMFAQPAGSPHCGAYQTTATATNPVALTPGQYTLDPSYWPDGAGFLCSTIKTGDPFPASLDLERFTFGAPPRRLHANALADFDAYASPDGAHIAWLRRQSPALPNGLEQWDILRARADGAGETNLTGGATDAPHGAINSKPQWSRDGRTLYFHRLRYGVDAGFRLWKLAPLAPTPAATLVQLDAGQPGPNEYPNL